MKITMFRTGYVGLSDAVLLDSNSEFIVLDIIPRKSINTEYQNYYEEMYGDM